MQNILVARLSSFSIVTRADKVWLAFAALLAVVASLDWQQAQTSVSFIANAVLRTFPYLLASVALASYIKATGADNLVSRAFAGPLSIAIVGGAVMGALAPFCSCGVVPIIVALLSIGVPLAPVMAFWLASPLMDPTMFLLTAGTLGWDFAVAKTIAAISVGLLGGLGVLLLQKFGLIGLALRDGVGTGGCAGSRVRKPKEVVWRFWTEPARKVVLRSAFATNTAFLAKWLLFAFLLESLMVAYIPSSLIIDVAGGTGLQPIALAVLVGIPSYINGYAALPLVNGLLEQGLAPGAAMAFLVAGGVTSLPAAMAVAAVARGRVFGAYLGFAMVGAFLSGLGYALWS